MSYRHERTGLGSIIYNPFVKLLSLLNFRRSVHPENPLQLLNSEFLHVNNDKYKIRILHQEPNRDCDPMLRSENRLSYRKRNSLSEEYWFTRWNKPLQTAGNRCSCSFRRSQRYSKVVIAEGVDTQTKSNFETPPTRIKDFTTFVERLIEESIIEAFQEFVVIKNGNTNNVYDNLAFVKDKTDTAVPLRALKVSKEQGDSKLCPHKKTNEKPFIFLLHGIGCNADTWMQIMESLLCKGYEVAAPDMLGHGFSSAPNRRKAYKFKRLLEHSLAVFDQFAQRDEKRKFVIIGHSFGCSLATGIARYRSQQVVQLVLISGGGPTALSAPYIRNEISVFGALQVLISPLLFCGIKRSFFYSSRGKHFKPCRDDPAIPKYVLEHIAKEQNWPEGDATFHRRILIPTLLVHGLKDTTVTLVQECEMERTIPRASLELIPTVGHMSIEEAPEQLSHMILCFVDWWSR